MYSKIIRRSHMYLALFLTPWVLVYTLSTAAMNHREFFRDWYGDPAVEFETLESRSYDGTFPEGATRQQIGLQILSDLGMEGSFSARRGENETVVIQRQHAMRITQVVYDPDTRQLSIERELFRTPNFLERMHRRRGFRQDFLLEDLWAFTVDFFIVAMVLWALSGVWMWWEMRVTRGWGAICLSGGLLLFACFLFTI